MKYPLLRRASSLQLPSRQRGVVLLVSLLFLVVLTLLGVAASRMVIGEEKMSRYLREYNTAFQAAESAMRDAHDDIDGIFADGTTTLGETFASAVYLLGLNASSSWSLKSWDHFILPKPFSTITVDIVKQEAPLTKEALQKSLIELNH